MKSRALHQQRQQFDVGLFVVDDDDARGLAQQGQPTRFAKQLGFVRVVGEIDHTGL
jgi:hypothetical protein